MERSAVKGWSLIRSSGEDVEPDGFGAIATRATLVAPCGNSTNCHANCHKGYPGTISVSSNCHRGYPGTSTKSGWNCHTSQGY